MRFYMRSWFQDLRLNAQKATKCIQSRASIILSSIGSTTVLYPENIMPLSAYQESAGETFGWPGLLGEREIKVFHRVKR